MKSLPPLFNDFVNPQYELTAFQRKIIIALLAKVQTTDNQRPTTSEPTSTARLNIGDILKDLELRMSFYEIKEEVTALLKRIYEIETTEDLLLTSFIENAIFEKGKGVIEFQINRTTTKYWSAIKSHFGLMQLYYLLGFRSKYTILIYLLLLEQQARTQNEKTYELSGLKRYLEIEGRYRDYTTFKTRVILQAQKELHLSNLPFSFQEIKASRKIQQIRLTIQPIHSRYHSKSQDVMIQKLQSELQLTASQAKKIAINFMPQEIFPIIYQVKDQHRSGQIRTNLAAYTIGVFDRLLLGFSEKNSQSH